MSCEFVFQEIISIISLYRNRVCITDLHLSLQNTTLHDSRVDIQAESTSKKSAKQMLIAGNTRSMLKSRRSNLPITEK